MSTPDTPLVERLCRSLAFHVVETEGEIEAISPPPEDLIAEVVKARELITEAGFDFDVLYPVADRPQFSAAE